jgi:diaminohydroxyphosphoribosylaminopyrimidine deaminase / 5-amino-6-(5-phosphoribosylamino)uracil reductase
MNKNEYFILECLKLAERGAGFVSPNPLVGCVIVKNNKVIGKGYHRVFGKAHAEINAINDAKKNGYELKGTTLYVNLEPCNHSGKTPPCTDAIIKEKIKNVIIGMKDPNKDVKGNGINKLRASGINVTTRILQNECEELNRFYLKYITQKRPYVTLKIAMSLDGKIALNDFTSKWITNEESRKFVHRLRSFYDAILIGKNSALQDNPSLDVRNVKGRNPVRLIIDRNATLPINLNVYKDDNYLNTYTFISSKLSESNKIANKKINKIFLNENNHTFQLKNILKAIYELEIASVMVEGGGNLFGQFIKENLFDDIYCMIAPKIIGKGIPFTGQFEVNRMSSAKSLNLRKIITSKEDVILYYKNSK